MPATTRGLRAWVAALVLGGAATSAAANDSSAEMPAGGLVLTKNASIEMRGEDLYISARQVRVRYRFANTSGKDVTILVAFPMPDITTNGVEDMISVPTKSPTNILGFSTTVDGRPVHAQVEQKVLKNGVDRTAYLRALSVPLAPHLRSTAAALDRLPKARQDELLKLGLAAPDDYDAGKGYEHHLGPTWTLKTTFFWRQTFPAGREIEVDHRYQPSVGESVGTAWQDPTYAAASQHAGARRRYCIDDDFLAGIARARQARKPAGKPPVVGAGMSELRIDYVLSTGANWKAPIGDFRMVVDKGDPANRISFCADGVRKISSTQFEVRHANFTPVRDVEILILKPPTP
jgi:hypothetical protein